MSSLNNAFPQPHRDFVRTQFTELLDPKFRVVQSCVSAIAHCFAERINPLLEDGWSLYGPPVAAGDYVVGIIYRVEKVDSIALAGDAGEPFTRTVQPDAVLGAAPKPC